MKFYIALISNVKFFLNMQSNSLYFLVILILSLVMGIVLNFTMFLCTIVNSALTTTIVGVLKGVGSTVCMEYPQALFVVQKFGDREGKFRILKQPAHYEILEGIKFSFCFPVFTLERACRKLNMNYSSAYIWHILSFIYLFLLLRLLVLCYWVVWKFML